VFYHARVSCKPTRAKESPLVGYEYDLSREDLLGKIALPFIRKDQFFCGGAVILPEHVIEVKFSETQQTARELVPLIEARRRMHGVISISAPEKSLVSEGRDVTREILDEAVSKLEEGEKPKQAEEKSDRVFIVHGHDQRAVDQTEILIHRFGLSPIILRNEPNQGNTVIEKFEVHSKVGFAIVLLTPDDVGCIAATAPAGLQARARQNVIWEWGYLVAKLGRPNVICLYKTGVELPSDLHGLVTINISDDVRDSAEEIRRELVVAGYKIS
jgi:predicted nucleotide-binding protein